MAQYDVYPNDEGTGYLLDIQTDLLQGMTTRLVAPLMRVPDAPRPIARLNPLFEIEGEKVVLVTQLMAAVPVSILRSPKENLSGEFTRITSAIDMVTHGY